MARKKRKYIRHKLLRHDTVPLSSVVVGLLPILLMAGMVGAYIIYQYTDVFRTPLPAVPTIAITTPEIHFPGVTLPAIHLPEIRFPEMHIPALPTPEITISFDELWQSIAAFFVACLNMLMTASEQTVHLAGQAGAWGVSEVERGGMYVISGLLGVTDFCRQSISTISTATTVYFRTLGWTINDFFTYLDLPGKGQTFLNTIFWPFHFLDPRPAVSAGNEKIQEAHQTLAVFLKPFGPILDYIGKSFHETMDGLWKSVTDLWNFLNWLAQQSKK